MNDSNNRFVYLIEITHGEWDDYTHTPVFVCETETEAQLICEAIENRYISYISKIRNYSGFLADLIDNDLAGAQYTKLPVERV